MDIHCTQTLEFESQWPLDALRTAFGKARRVVLVAHTNADGDAVGSICGMAQALRNHAGAQCTPLLPDGVPDDLLWLPGTDGVLNMATQADLCAKAIAEADTLIAMDINSLSRTGRLESLLREAHFEQRLLVDHHEAPRAEEFDLIVSEPELSSTCELAYWLVCQTIGEGVIDRAAAECLFAGICTDTGTFSYSNRRQSLYIAAASLLRHGIDPAAITSRVRNTFSTRRLQFFGFAMAERLQVYDQQGVALMTLSAADMAAHGVQSHELTGLINEVMRLRDVDCGILVREEGANVRLSLRSKVRYDVNRLAGELFGGGGHVRAAGATSHLSLADTVAAVRRKLGLLMLPLALLLCVACGEVPVVEQNTGRDQAVREAVIEANRHVAHTEAQQIEQYLARRSWSDAEKVGQSRLHIVKEGTGAMVENGDTINLIYSIQTLGGDTIYDDAAETLTAGRLQPTPGLDASLLRMRRGTQAVVVVPSEQAYGVAGDGQRIGGRTVLVYNVQLLER